MGDLVVFVPQAQRDALENLRDFVAICRDRLTVFGRDLEFDSNVWDVTESARLKAQGRKRVRVYFSNLATVDEATPQAMAEPFLSFGKAYLRYMQGMRPTKVIHFRTAALRALESALAERSSSPNPVCADAAVFNRAAHLITDRFGKEAAYRVGGQLQMVAEFMAKNRLTTTPLQWRSWIKRPAQELIRVGKEFDDRRRARLPSAAVLEALPRAFRLAKEPPDVLVSSIAAVLLSAPDRINEVLLLPFDCEVFRQQPGDKGEVYGLRWWPAKGAEPMIKWVIPVMDSVVEEAIANIRRVTKPARDVAKWYALHPDKMYLPANFEHLRSREFLKMAEVAEAVFDDPTNRGAGRSWCKNNGVQTKSVGGSLVARFADIERVVLAMLPEGFPWINREVNLEYPDALILVRRNELHADKTTLCGVIDPVSITQINDRLGGGDEHGKASVFSRLGLTAVDGKSLVLTTHQLRHYLNTLADAGGLTQIEIAKWSGRKDIRQNAAYSHVPEAIRVEQIRKALGDSERLLGPLAELPKKVPIPREDFARLQVPTAHTTDFGYCIHSYVMSPCQQFSDCLNCAEHICIKGDAKKAEMLRNRLVEAQRMLAIAEERMQQKGGRGVDRWREHQRLTVQRLEQLVAIHDDPACPNGTVIQLAISDTPSRLRQAVEARSILEGRRDRLGKIASSAALGASAMVASRPTPASGEPR